MTTGYYVETWGGGCYGVESWHATEEQAKKRLAFIMHSGRWSGKPPRIVPCQGKEQP